nr:NHL repeat-containing protein 2-like [Cherax quadricarinatus]
MEEETKSLEEPARNISELTLVCMELARRVEDASSREDKMSVISEHILTYTQNKITMTDFEAGLEWFNVSHPLTLAGDLKGRIVVLDFFTYCCINCMHILPDLEALEKEHPPQDGEVLVVGVHSAKFDNERVSSNILAAIDKYHIHHPVVNDPQGKMWTQLGITCWPTLLILGPSGNPLFVLVGEGHCESLQVYVNTAVTYFNSSGCLSKCAVGLAPSRHLTATGSSLLYPGKITTHPGGLVVSDSGHNRVLMTDHKGNVFAISHPGNGLSWQEVFRSELKMPMKLYFCGHVWFSPNLGHISLKIRFHEHIPHFIISSSYSKGTVVRLAGSGAEENRNTSYPARAGFAQPSGLAVGTHSGSSVLYIADSESSSIRRMSLADGAVKAVVGAARDPLDLFAYGDVDGIGIDAKLQHPLAVATVGDCVYLADSYNHKVSYQ